jgi:hypothetical protein
MMFVVALDAPGCSYSNEGVILPQVRMIRDLVLVVAPQLSP